MKKKSISINLPIKPIAIAIIGIISLAALIFVMNKRNEIYLNEDLVFGEKNAPIELVEYASFGCKHCAEFHKNSFNKIKSDLIDTGKVKYVLKNFPNSQNSLYASMLTKCVAKPDRESLISELFENQDKWANTPTLIELKEIAKNNGIKDSNFYSCIENKELSEKILSSQREDARKFGIRSTPTFVINGEKIRVASNAADIIAAVNEVSQGKMPNEKFEAASSELLKVTKNDNFIGNAEAPVTIVEYASLSCPHCAKFHTEVLPQLKKEYVDSGKVKFVFRDFPLNEPALRAAMIGQCSNKNNYFKVLAKMFEKQSEWAFDKEYLTKLSSIVSPYGFSKSKFDSCLANKEIEKIAVESRYVAASKLGVESTPTFFVNGVLGDHLHSVDEFKKAIEAELNKAK